MKNFIFTVLAILNLSSVFSQTADLHQYYNATSKDNFYTTNFQELGKGGYPWEYKGVLCKVFTNSGSGLIPVYRYFNKQAGHFYTTNYDELKSGGYDWKYENIGFYINKNNVNSMETLYRYCFIPSNTHFYTTNFSLYGKGNNGVRFEGEMGYVSPKGGTNSGINNSNLENNKQLTETDLYNKINDIETFKLFTSQYPNSKFIKKIDKQSFAYPNDLIDKTYRGIDGCIYETIGDIYFVKNDTKSQANNYFGFLLIKMKGVEYYYSGTWTNNQLNGKGKIIEKNDDPNYIEYYEGSFLNGRVDGLGKFYSSDGQNYEEGQYKEGKAFGKGKIVSQDFGLQNGAKLGTYEGEWGFIDIGTERNGYGRLTLDNGNWFEGKWKKNKKIGDFKYHIAGKEPIDCQGQYNNSGERIGDHICHCKDWLGNTVAKFILTYDNNGNKISQTILEDNTNLQSSSNSGSIGGSGSSNSSTNAVKNDDIVKGKTAISEKKNQVKWNLGGYTNSEQQADIKFADDVNGRIFAEKDFSRYYISNGISNYYYKSESDAIRALYIWKKYSLYSEVGRY